MTPPPNTSAAPAALVRGDDGSPDAASLALVESYRRLADVFHDVLSEQSLDAVLERIADTIAELIPHDDLAFYEADEDNAPAAGRPRARRVRRRGARRRAVRVRARDHGLGRRAPPARAREPRRPRPSRPFVEGTPPDPESLIAVPLIARGRHQGRAQHLPRRADGSSPRRSSMLAVRFGDAAALALDNAHVRATPRAPGPDRSSDRALEPPRIPRAAPQRGRSRLVRARVGRTPDARPRRLQARQRHLRARRRRPGARRARRRAPGGGAPERRRLPHRRRGVRDHPPLAATSTIAQRTRRAGRGAGRARRVLSRRPDDRSRSGSRSGPSTPPTPASSSPARSWR